MGRTTIKLLVAFSCIFPFTSQALSQNPSPREAIRANMMKLLRYVELETSATASDVDRLVEFWIKAGQPDISLKEREAAFLELNVLYSKLHGTDLSRNPQVLSGVVRRSIAAFQAGGKLDLRLPEPRGPAAGDYIHVSKQGHGPTEMLLISAAGIDGRELYRSFVERHRDRYTMHVVTLPGAGLAKPLPWPEVYDLTRRPWLTNIEQSLLRWLEKRKGKLVVVGTTSGGYFAARLSALRPEKIRAAILVDALVNIAMPSPSSPDRPASIQERLALMKRFTPPQLFPTGQIPQRREEIKKLLDDPNNTHPAVRNWMAFTVRNEALSKQWSLKALASGFFMRGLRYGFELQSTDLTEDLRDLAVPILAMSAIHDEKSPRSASPGPAQWEEIKRLYPKIPLSTVTIANTRSFISEDSPAEFDQALTAFLAGK